VTTARVLNVVPTLMCGGTENQFMTLARTLDRVRFDVEFACLRRWGGFVEELVARNIPLTEYPVATFRSFAAVAQQARLTRHIVRRGIKIVLAYNFYGNVFATLPARLVAPVVIASIRDRAPYLTAMQKRVQRYTCQFADCILQPESINGPLQDYILRSKIFLGRIFVGLGVLIEGNDLQTLLAQLHQHDIHGHAMQPGREGRFTAEAGNFSKQLHEGFLGEVFSLGRIGGHAQTQ
jgi:hypothetical protein